MLSNILIVTGKNVIYMYVISKNDNMINTSKNMEGKKEFYIFFYPSSSGLFQKYIDPFMIAAVQHSSGTFTRGNNTISRKMMSKNN